MIQTLLGRCKFTVESDNANVTHGWQISYNEFAQKLKRSDVSGQLISDYDYSGEVSGLTRQQREKMRHDQGIM